MGIMFFLLFLALLAFGIYKTVQRDAHGNFNLQPQRGAAGYGLAILFLFMMVSFTSVPTGTRAVVTRFGNVNRTLEPGAHLLLPFAEFTHEINVQTQTVKPSEHASSHDLQVVATEVTLAFHYDPNYAGYIYSQLAGDARDSVIVPSILEAIKSTTALYDAQALISERPKVRDGIEDFVKARLAPYHIVAETVSITDFNFSDEFNKSIEAKVTAQQHAEKAQNDLTRIQIEAQQQVAQAKGEAEALRAQREQITPELLQLRTIEMMKEKWDGRLPETYYGGTAPLPMMEVFKKHDNAK
jgi:prohibitin 2